MGLVQIEKFADVVAPMDLEEIIKPLLAPIRIATEPLRLAVGMEGRVSEDIGATIRAPALHVREQVRQLAIAVREVR